MLLGKRCFSTQPQSHFGKGAVAFPRRAIFLALAVLFVLSYWFPPVASSRTRPTVKELKSVPGNFSAGLAAVRKWDYQRAYLIFYKVAYSEDPKAREASEWREKVGRIMNNNVEHQVKPGETWEQIAREHFRERTVASRLATYNGSSVVESPQPGSTVLIPLVHLAAHLAFTAFDDPETASLDSLRAALRHMETALEIDPDYPDLEDHYRWVMKLYEQRQVEVKVESLEMTAELYVAEYEFNKAIDALREAQQLSYEPAREGKIRSLIRKRERYLPIWFEIGNQCFREDDLSGALEAWRKVAVADPDYKDVRARIQKVQTMLRSLEKFEDSAK